MKTTTLALSLLAATGGAAAQSSLTVFGVVDAGIRYATNANTANDHLQHLRLSFGEDSEDVF